MATGSMEKQGVTPEAEGLTGPKQGDVKNLKLIIQPENMMEVDEAEECKTPTGSRNQIPAILKCPPAPKKKRVPDEPPQVMGRSSSAAYELSFFESIGAQELELFFKSMYEFSITRANKKCKSI